ncbi:hypothetical protein FBU30_001667 [Linnemannia zychae]|nr:hypothetical protein FBU30_001667 [Linnemannia zychae]
MQPTLFMRSNLTHLPRSISPHLSSSSASSASSPIRSLSPSRHSSHLRSRSASPSPRRFASVLAYHATPPLENFDKQRTASSDQQLQNFQRDEDRDRRSREQSRTKEHREQREDSASRTAMKNLEESRKRLELDSSPSSPSLVSSTTAFGSSPLSARSSSSPSPLSRPPYRELIECTFFKDNKVLASTAENESGSSASVARESEGRERETAAEDSQSAVLKSESNKNNNNNHSNDDDQQISREHRHTTIPTRDTASSTTAATIASTVSSTATSSSKLAALSSDETDTMNQDQQQHQEPHQHQHHQVQPQQQQQQARSAFLTSKEARHILDLPSLLGQDPEMISRVLAMPIPLQANHHSSLPSSLSDVSTTSSHNRSNGEEDTMGSALISKLNAKAESAAEAMTKRYSVKNLDMTETEAHRMVQVMAAEIVALHEERALMAKKLEQAKVQMLEAAQLLRMKAAASEPEELQDMSAEGRRRRSLANGSDTRLSAHIDQADSTTTEKEKEELSEVDRQRRMYDRDEWHEEN